MAKAKGLTFYQKESKLNKEFFKGVLELVVATVIVVFLAFGITYVFGSRTGIIGDSMEEALPASSQVLINRFVYMVSAPKRGDVIVFLPYGNTNTHYYTKRVVGLPGETIQIIEGRLYVDGYAAESQDAYDYIEDAGMAESPILLGEKEYFVLGDNRNSSEDSRSGNIGPVNRDNIIGKAWMVIPGKDGRISLVE
ncbi:signal peptidase I [Lachnospiraceae bacterium XBB2008]|nr:signal peptidase I [Lachnospiraceae bacterium]SCY55023.1 signal peptidase I [Lachnospiraceae bacterium XBB2008]